MYFGLSVFLSYPCTPPVPPDNRECRAPHLPPPFSRIIESAPYIGVCQSPWEEQVSCSLYIFINGIWILDLRILVFYWTMVSVGKAVASVISEWVWSTGEILLTGKFRSTRRRACPYVTFSTGMSWNGWGFVVRSLHLNVLANVWFKKYRILQKQFIETVLLTSLNLTCRAYSTCS
jgi:hypothetical protein